MEIVSKTEVKNEADTMAKPGIKENSSDAMDVFLKKIGGKHKSASNPIAELLGASEELIKISEECGIWEV